MKGRPLLLFIILLIINQLNGFSQDTQTGNDMPEAVPDTLTNGLPVQSDTLKKTEVLLSHDEAIRVLQKTLRMQPRRSRQDPFPSAVGQLIFTAANPPFDSTAYFLKGYPYDSLRISGDEIYFRVPVDIKIPGDPLTNPDSSGFELKRDTLILSGFEGRNDSIKAAVNVLLDYIEVRDSSIIKFTGPGIGEFPLWLNSKSGRMIRIWLKNGLNDSVTVWIGNTSRNTVGLYLEHGVDIWRPGRQGNVSEARINVEPQDNTTLINIGKIITKSQFWRFRTEASFALNQGMVTNWVKGGENSISTALDITWFADYSNKQMLLSSGNFARIKYGLIKSGNNGIKKNIDLLETNSKVNHKAFGKFDFSGIMLFKTQVSKGYSYPNDSVPVSKFINPAVLTIGFGLDYKPNKQTSINLSPLSYKATFVPDTVSIDQTKYGVAPDRRSKHEPGASFMITNEMRPVKNMVIINRLQLFTNYINNPLNIDVDWEMIFQANLNWFTDVRLNTHLMFDDDTRTLVFDRDKNPVMGNDGIQKKSARIQFKELLGLSFIFRF
jgi:hypothetical protein